MRSFLLRHRSSSRFPTGGMISSLVFHNYRIHYPYSRCAWNASKKPIPLLHHTVPLSRYLRSPTVLMVPRKFSTRAGKESTASTVTTETTIQQSVDVEIKVITDYVTYVQEQASGVYSEDYKLETYEEDGKNDSNVSSSGDNRSTGTTAASSKDERMKDEVLVVGVDEDEDSPYNYYIIRYPDLSDPRGLAKVIPEYVTPPERAFIDKKLLEWTVKKYAEESESSSSTTHSRNDSSDELDWSDFDDGERLRIIYENIPLQNHKDKSFSTTGILLPEPLPDSLRQQLLHQIDTYLNKPTTLKDYHPGSNDKVRDIIHPSLYPYVHGLSIVESGTDPQLATVFEPKPVVDNPKPIRWTRKIEYDRWGREIHNSKRYQWLPSEFGIDNDGKVKINSYINNLPTEETELYKLIGQAFEHVLPALEQSYNYSQHVSYYNGYSDRKDDDSSTKVIKKNTGLLRNRSLQVITKIVRITLPPYSESAHAREKDNELVGSWHAEGMSNEHIVATASITLAKDPSFTATIRFKRPYTQNEAAYLFYNMAQNPPYTVERFLNDEYVPLGKIQIKEKDIIVFPNSHIHRIDMVNDNTHEEYLPDTEAEQERCPPPNPSSSSSEPGRPYGKNTEPVDRTVLVFWLIDPDQRILSTQHIKEQYKHNPQFTLEKAYEHRHSLMTERTSVKQKYNQQPLNLCEH